MQVTGNSYETIIYPQATLIAWRSLFSCAPKTITILCYFTLPQPPVVVTNQPIYIEPGETFLLTRSVLHIEDYDNPQDVLLMVLEPPQHGRLTRAHGDGQVSRFKLEELVREQLQYIHDGTSGEQDRLLLQINDGHSYQNILVHVSIAQRVSDHYRIMTYHLWPLDAIFFFLVVFRYFILQAKFL